VAHTTIAPALAGFRAAHRFRVGQLDLRVLDEGAFTVTGDFLAFNAPPRALAKSLAANGRSPTGFLLPIHPLLIETAGRLVLVDTGYGDLAGTLRPDAGKLAAALRGEGIAPEMIEAVLLTHVHPDHAGGAIDAAGRPTFPNARYLVTRVEHEFWWGEPSLDGVPFPAERKQFLRQVAKDVLVALEGQIEHVEPGSEIAPGVTVLAAPGHTPGHIAIAFASGDERLLHVGDAAADPVLHLRHPEWFLAPDYWPAEALMTRRRLFDRAAAEGMLVMTSHFAFPGLGHVTHAGEGWRWMPVNTPRDMTIDTVTSQSSSQEES
jgi:glyoxylase-like metal-dependent hydrolase (beta-lactamase superfamily II)